jgi:protein phosphatase
VRTDVGKVRATNQDSACGLPVPGAEEWVLLAVADGVGGHQGGEWASARAIDFLSAELAAALAGGDPAVALARTMEAASTALWDSARDGDGIPGAATTLVAALVRGDEAWWANIGDSRIYLVASGKLSQLSEDHSWVAERVREGVLTPAEAAVSPHRNVVTRTVGFERLVVADHGGPLKLAPGDVLVLCSDGLHGRIADDVIAEAAASLDPDAASRRLVDLANEAGGQDNITVIVCRAGGGASAPFGETPTLAPARRRAFSWGIALAVASAAFLGALATLAFVLAR